MSGANWDLRPTKIFMHPADYRDLVIWSLVEDDGWTESAAEKEADRRLEVMQKDQETHLKEAVEALSKVEFSEGAKTFGGVLLRGAFEGTFPPGVDDAHRAEFYASEKRPVPMIRAYLLGLSHRDGGLSPSEQEEWQTLQGAHPPVKDHKWETEILHRDTPHRRTWICRRCGASGGPVDPEGDPPFMEPFLVGTGLKVGPDCDRAKFLIEERRERDRAEQAFRDSMPSYLNPHNAEDRKTWRVMQSGALSAEHPRSPEAKEARRERVHEVRDTWRERMAEVDATVARLREAHDPEVETTIKAHSNTIKLILWARERFEIGLLEARCLIEGHPTYLAKYSAAPIAEQHVRAATLTVIGGVAMSPDEEGP